MGPIAIFIILVFVFTLISKRIESTILTAPMIFTVTGMGVFLVFPSLAALEIQDETVLSITELTLALLLFTDATHIHLRQLLKEMTLPLRLLGIGMPLTILAGTLVGLVLFPGFSVWEAALLAVILAPTDAGLGQVVVKSSLVPKRIREALEVEAGLNDGLSMPFFSLFIGLALSVDSLGSGSWLIYTAEQIGFGLLAGIAVGWVGGWLLGEAGRRGWVDEGLQQLGLLMLAVTCYGGAGLIGGNGFIAAFVGGLLVKRGFEDAHFHSADFSEAWGQLLNYFVFFTFGMIVTQLLPDFNSRVFLYAILSLTIARMLPVAIAMMGSRLQIASVLFLGWFGPRGLASIVLGLIFLERELQRSYQNTITEAVAFTVLLSILAHGLTALPGMRWYAKKIDMLGSESPELQDASSILPG
jgi:NhaP-type Na+/H+ or K+/H+ antiporter